MSEYSDALAAQAVLTVQEKPGLTIVQVARAMGLRMVLCWDAVAAGIESGTLQVHDSGLFAAGGPAAGGSEREPHGGVEPSRGRHSG